MKLRPLCFAISLAFIAHPAFSDTNTSSTGTTTNHTTKQDDKQTKNYSGGAKLGFIYSKSTDAATSLNSGFWVTYKPSSVSHTLKAYTYYTNSTDDDDGVNKYVVSYKFANALDDANSFFITHQYQHDQTSTYRQKYTLTTGIEHKLIHTKDTTLSIGGGPGYRYTKRQASDDNYPNEETNDVIANGFIEGKSKLSDSLSIGGSGNVDYGESDTTYTFDANLTNKLINNVALALDTQYIYNTDVSSSTSHDEIYSTISITYAF